MYLLAALFVGIDAARCTARDLTPTVPYIPTRDAARVPLTASRFD